MGRDTAIAWTDHTANFWLGCLKVSPGCKHCYAETLTRDRMGLKVWGPRSGRQVAKAVWQNVPKWDAAARAEGRSRRVFCMSLGDFFEDHADLPEARERAWDLIRRCDALDWQILTKRPENIAAMLPPDWGAGWEHVWLGVSIEHDRVRERADRLREIPAAVRFVSYEPALGPLAGCLDLSELSWLIYGGESGNNRRPEGTPEDPKLWARVLRDACREAGVAYFHKQSSHRFAGRGVELDGEILQEFPRERRLVA